MRAGFILLFGLFTLISLCGQQVQLSPASKISVLTCGPGEELYSSFGHSALRVQDSSQGIDIVYNYGVFDTRGENFYFRFSQGRMDYLLVRNRFFDFLEEYKIDNRLVNEQILDLDQRQRNQLFRFLENNARPENRVYQYDFFHNNCATKIWDVLKTALGDDLTFEKDYATTTYTFRQLIRHYLKTNSWGQFGIDLALGSVIDRQATPQEHMFLPDYISEQIKDAKLGAKPLSFNSNSLIMAVQKEQKSSFLATPLFWILLFLAITILMTYRDYKRGKRSRWFDFLLFSIVGLHGLLIFYLWFLTDHVWTVKNFNILWVFPLNLVVAFFLLKKKSAKVDFKISLGTVVPTSCHSCRLVI